MFNPKYRIVLNEKCFINNEFMCLGNQLTSIISHINNSLKPHLWYAADVEVAGNSIKKNDFSGIKLNLIGDDSQFIEYCSHIEQFVWGVFVCIDIHFSQQNFHNIKLETEDESFRPINAKGVLLEIRTFDTTFFEIYFDNILLAKQISQKYDSAIKQIN